MVPVRSMLKVEKYQELNEPCIFSWRYMKKHLGADYIFPFDLCWYGNRKMPTVRVVVTLRWRNKARRVGEMIAYDERNGYCLLGTENFPARPKSTVPDIRRVCLRHGQAYLERLYDVAYGRADELHEDSRHSYLEYKERLRKRLGL